MKEGGWNVPQALFVRGNIDPGDIFIKMERDSNDELREFVAACDRAEETKSDLIKQFEKMELPIELISVVLPADAPPAVAMYLSRCQDQMKLHIFPSSATVFLFDTISKRMAPWCCVKNGNRE